MKPGHRPAVVGDGKVGVEPDGLAEIVQGGLVIVERPVGVAAVQVQERRLGGLADRLVEIAEGLAEQSRAACAPSPAVERFHVPGRTRRAWLQSSMAWARRFSMKWMLPRQRYGRHALRVQLNRLVAIGHRAGQVLQTHADSMPARRKIRRGGDSGAARP